MKRTAVWIIVGVLGLGLLIILPGLFMGGMWGLPFGLAGGWGFGPGSGIMNGRMMDGGMMGGMMAGYGGFSYSPLGWIGALLGWAIQLGLLALIVLGIVWLTRRLRTPAA